MCNTPHRGCKAKHVYCANIKAIPYAALISLSLSLDLLIACRSSVRVPVTGASSQLTSCLTLEFLAFHINPFTSASGVVSANLMCGRRTHASPTRTDHLRVVFRGLSSGTCRSVRLHIGCGETGRHGCSSCTR